MSRPVPGCRCRAGAPGCGAGADPLPSRRISYCTTDKLQNKVFAYVAQSQQSGALECHAFLSPKKKIAQAVTLTVAQAFQVALDLWEAARAGSRQEQPLRPSCALESSEPGSTRAPAPMGNTPLQHLGEEEEEDDDLDEAFPSCTEEGAPGLAGLTLPAPGAGTSCVTQLAMSWPRLGRPPDGRARREVGARARAPERSCPAVPLG
ncbi:carboxyl-terminal PDZ ligand of neuronal nitric oxide synthase protein-like [Alligator mississippiensis]|uniref:Carboxyl-terminal PDZ ligand of neuronal nitric oxide synthase protein-like n=1 Tax=Alligator mississippiensis TaxID=8496 RepID=A0A151PGE1_ALLMI|nr:carboxyl-terminal PDZ ligand of neuronal nitric oxide synthase protein-like [Alligator mississippiensis]